MKPRTLSASSLQVAQLCMARWKAQYVDRVQGIGGTAANLGTTCHQALEDYVQNLIATHNTTGGKWVALEANYRIAFQKLFGHDTSVPEFKDGMSMLRNWHRRTDFSDRDIISCEQKNSFDIPTSVGKIRFNYIIDRLDKIGNNEYEVVDYKSQRFPVTHDELRKKIQARAYALAVQIAYPQAEKIWVTFDLLRHTPVSVLFTKSDNADTWRFLKALAQHIVDTPEDKAKETLNKECRFCPIKASCTTLTKNAASGGEFSINSVDEAVAALAQITGAIGALDQMKGDIEDFIMKFAAETESTEWETEDGNYSVTVGFGNGKRYITDLPKLMKLLPDEVVSRYARIGVTELDKMIKEGEIDDGTASQARALVSKNPGAPKVTIKAY